MSHTKLEVKFVEVKKMNNANHSIQCSVQQCEHHCGKENYCTLNTVNIGTHELNPTKDECVDCKSFELKR